MTPDRTDSDPVLASLRAKVAAWQAAVDSYLAAKAVEGSAEAGPGQAPRGPIELPVNAFRSMTMAEAVILFLKSVQRKQTVAEIADGLKAGGFVTTSSTFGDNVRSALNKLKTDGVLLRFPDGWDLAEAHSAMIRHRIAKETEKASSKKRRTKKDKPAARQTAKPSAKAAHTPKAKVKAPKAKPTPSTVQSEKSEKSEKLDAA